MKKISILLILALTLSLASCTAAVVDEENVDDVKNDAESVEAETPTDPEEPEIPELPWADGPVETPIIPPTFMEDEPAEAEPEVPAEPETPAETEEPELDDKELPILQIVPEENETPAIPIE